MNGYTIDNMKLPDGTTVEYVHLKEDEKIMLDQLMYNGYGGNPDLEKLFKKNRNYIEMYLGYIMQQRGMPFIGMRESGSGITGCILHPQHIASVASAATNINVGGWKAGLAARTGAGWTTRSQATADTAIFSVATIANDLWICIFGISCDYDLNTAATNIAAAQLMITGIRFTVDNVTYMPTPLYSASAISATTQTPLTHTPFIMAPEKSVFTEQLYVNDTITANNTAFHVRLIGITFGVGSVLAGL